MRYENKTVASFCSNSNGEKWASRLNYRLKPALCNAIRDVQVSHIQNRYQPSFCDTFRQMKALFGVSRLRGVAARVASEMLFSTMRAASRRRYTP